MDEPLAQAPAVELLEDVLVVEVLEDRDAARQLVVNLALGNPLARLLQQRVAIPARTRR